MGTPHEINKKKNVDLQYLHIVQCMYYNLDFM